MKIRRKKKWQWILGVSSLCAGLLIAGVGAMHATPANAELVWDKGSPFEEFYAEDYSVGMQVAVPEASIQIGSDAIETQVLIISPSGKGYFGNNILLEESGAYIVRYFGEKNGKTYSEEKTFDAYNHIYTVSSNSSTIDFGSVETLTNGQYKAGGKSGMVVDLVRGDTFSYNKIIDLSSYDSPNSELLNLSFLPHSLGSADAWTVVCTLSDLSNPDNTITIKMNKIGEGTSTGETRTYLTFNSPEQVPMGLEYGGNGYIYNGAGYQIHKADGWGAKAIVSMSGVADWSKGAVADLVATTEQEISLRFDYSERAFFLGQNLAMDLDDPTLEDYLWQGFTYDKCRLEIHAESYATSSMRLLFNSIDGKKMDKNEVAIDNEAPILTIDEEVFSSISYAVVGKSFPVPVATAFDLYDGDCKVETAVYTGYGSSQEACVVLKDNAFTPKSSRTYTIVYRAKDSFGNVAEKAFSVEAKETTKRITLNYGTPQTTAVLGQAVSIGVPTIENANGKYAVSVYAVYKGESTLLATITEENCYEQDYTFIPLNAGTYTLKYEYSDYLFAGSTSYDLQVTKDGASAIILEEPTLPKYIIQNATYETPVLFGYDFGSEGKGALTKTDVYVSSNSGELGEKVGDTFVVSQGEYSYLSFKLGDTVKGPYKIPVKDVKYGEKGVEIYKYFEGFAEMPLVEKSKTTYRVAENNGAYALSFINAVQTVNFSFEFTLPEVVNYDRIRITLTDIVDDANQLTVYYEKKGTRTKFASYGAEQTLEKEFAAGAKFKFTYKDGSLNATADGVTNILQVSMENGQAWEGFEEGMAWLTISFEKVSDATLPQLTVQKVNNQAIGYVRTSLDTAKDNNPPEIDTPTVKGYQKVGALFTLDSIISADVLCPYIDFIVSVKKPSGGIVKANAVDKEGNILKENVELKGADGAGIYQFTFEEFGAYIVSYESKDEQGNSVTYSYKINVVDEEAPSGNIGAYDKAVYVGKTVKLADVEIFDNQSGAEIIYVTVTQPNGVVVKVENNEFKAEMAGVYKIHYCIQDVAGNISFASYSIYAVQG